MDSRAILKYAVLACLAGGLALLLLRGRSGEYVPMKYFYDLSEETLYEVPRDSFAPHAGIGGAGGDGVEAIVIGCPEQCTNPDEPRIAYLKTHTEEYKQKRDESERTGQDIPGLTRPYISANTLVKLPDEDEWHTASSPEGQAIVSGWKTRCSHGKWTRPLFPE
jgi:hypothetical protein